MKDRDAIGNKIMLALAFGCCLLFATADDPEIGSLNLCHPTTPLPLVANRLHAIHASVREFQISDLLSAATAGFCEAIGMHESPTTRLE